MKISYVYHVSFTDMQYKGVNFYTSQVPDKDICKRYIKREFKNTKDPDRIRVLKHLFVISELLNETIKDSGYSFSKQTLSCNISIIKNKQKVGMIRVQCFRVFG